MGPRNKRRRLTDSLDDLSDSDIYRPATRLEQNSWNGFCEIESEPVRWAIRQRDVNANSLRLYSM